jgi:hypothetical protein
MKPEYDVIVNGEPYKVIEKLDLTGKRIWIKNWPKSGQGLAATILDDPNQVSWKQRESHIEQVEGNQKQKYASATRAGSVYVQDCVLLSKFPDDIVVVYPIPETGSPIPAMTVTGNTNFGSGLTIRVERPGWVALAAMRDPRYFGQGVETPYYDFPE